MTNEERNSVLEEAARCVENLGEPHYFQFAARMVRELKREEPANELLITGETDTRLLKLVDLLEKLVGNPIDGYWGSILIDDNLRALVGVARSELNDLLLFKERLEWLHSGSGVTDADGYEWGVARVKFDSNGQCKEVLWTNSDHGDLDAEISRTRKTKS